MISFKGEIFLENRFECIVIGAGQAGLAAAYNLQQKGIRYLVLEASEQTAVYVFSSATLQGGGKVEASMIVC